MPETFTPTTWTDGSAGGTPILASQLNRIETGVESVDDRAAALELGILSPSVITYAASLSLDATTASVFRIAATGALTITAITGAVDGQSVSVQVAASGAARTVTWSIGNVPTATIPSGTTATWTLRYYSTGALWTLTSYFVPDGGVTLTDGASVALDAAAGSVFKLTATGDQTILAPTNATHGQRITIVHVASGGARTLALTSGAAGFAFGATITALSATTSGLTDYIDAIFDSTANRWRIVGYNKGFA